MFSNYEFTKEMDVDEDFKEEILNTIREEVDLGFEDWEPEIKNLVKKTIRKELKKFAKRLERSMGRQTLSEKKEMSSPVPPAPKRPY